MHVANYVIMLLIQKSRIIMLQIIPTAGEQQMPAGTQVTIHNHHIGIRLH